MTNSTKASQGWRSIEGLLAFSRELRATLDSKLEGLSLSYSLLQALRQVHADEVGSVTGTARGLGISKKSASDLVQRLVILGLVNPDLGEDRRRKPLTVSESGRQTLASAEEIISKFYHDLFLPVRSPQWGTFDDVVIKLQRQLSRL